MTHTLVDQHDAAMARFAKVRRLVGDTPYLPLTFPECDRSRIHLKLEGRNPTGSVKDRTALCMLEHAITPDVLEAAPMVLDASSGNMGCSLLYFSMLLGLR